MNDTVNTPRKRRRKIISREGLPFVGYVRVSTVAQVDGTSLENQERALTAWASAQGVEIVIHRDEGKSGAKMKNRPGLMAAVADVVEGRAAGIVVARLDRLGRNMAETLTLADQARTEGWRLLALDVSLDTATAAGTMILGVMSAAAEYERMRISERQLEKHQGLRRAGEARGRPALDRDQADRIITMREAGETYRGIAQVFTDEGVPTARGTVTWHAASVRSAEITRRREIEAQAAA
jgi:DNA invertase Pin-like site-specific DNA recombinase